MRRSTVSQDEFTQKVECRMGRLADISLAVESKYDHPMLWGSKRTGPDLARLGEKYSDEWHVAHLINPRDVVPQSVMPKYGWLMRNELKTEDLGRHLDLR